ncbi:DUF192 domain-containing protein [Synechocystis sp. PCC 7509]|uniref:DUF192 domain-containing protein n=1 Tax=Synechocystis sp. PCC 7509 TaxID=927677 RepID=UPI0002ACF2E4|nr:DUF192 domain-containing protein [Synechocystis sp. PCC 7509]
MSRWLAVVGIMLSMTLMGCDSTSTAMPETTALGQSLPISAQLTIGNRVLGLEVAKTIEQQATGLMYRTTLADDRGMLFEFSPPQPVRFWMKNVAIPLDMIFIKDNQVQAIAVAVPPCNTEPCPTYGPGVLIDRVIEVRGGRAKELGFKVGAPVEIKFLQVKK